jgi:SOS response regulatory protein OraA/RecX
MGELLQFPGNRAGSEAQQEPEREAREGVERSSAPSRHPSRGKRPADVDESEPRWAVPGVDEHEAPAPAESTRASRRAENVALAALTRHDASEGEIRAKLVAKGLEEAEVEGELDRLRRVGLIDDTAFATRLLDRLRERKGLGDQAIRSTLRGRLVPQDVIDGVLADQAEDEETAAERLQEVADDRARKLGALDRAVAERRLTAFLMRKGYSGSSVRTAVRAALEGAGIR